MTYDPDIPVIIVAALGLLLFAILASVVVAMFVRPIERRMHQAAEQIEKLESGKAGEGDLRSALSIVAGIALFMLTLIGVITIAKGMGLGAMGKGVGILAFAGGFAALWAIYALVRAGHAKWLFGVLGVGAATIATVVGLNYSGRTLVSEEVRGAYNELSGELSADVKEAVVDVGDDLFAAGGDVIRLGDDKPDDAEADHESVDHRPEPPTPDITIGEAKEPLPDWAKQPVEAGHTLIVSDPFLTEALAHDDAVQRLARRAVAEYNEHGRGGLDHLPDEVDPRELWDKFVVNEFVDCRETSFGDTYVVHAEGVVNEETVSWFEEVADEYVVTRQRRRGLIAVSAGGGGVLLALSALYGALSLGEKRAA